MHTVAALDPDDLLARLHNAIIKLFAANPLTQKRTQFFLRPDLLIFYGKLAI